MVKWPFIVDFAMKHGGSFQFAMWLFTRGYDGDNFLGSLDGIFWWVCFVGDFLLYFSNGKSTRQRKPMGDMCSFLGGFLSKSKTSNDKSTWLNHEHCRFQSVWWGGNGDLTTKNVDLSIPNQQEWWYNGDIISISWIYSILDEEMGGWWLNGRNCMARNCGVPKMDGYY